MSIEFKQKEAERLVREGYRQKSRKYCKVIQIGSPTIPAIELLKERDINQYNALMERMKQFLETEARILLWHYNKPIELDPETFELFRKARIASGDPFP